MTLHDYDWNHEVVIHAITVLKSIGIQNLCLPPDQLDEVDWLLDPLRDALPICDNYEPYINNSEDWIRQRGLLLLENGIEERDDDTGELLQFYIVNVGGALFCVLFVALISGLFLGMLTLDLMDLQIIERSSIDDEERRYASKLIPIVKERHRLLVTLLIMNALAYETLPLFLDNLVPSWVAILLSTTFILVFGEILPSGIFMGPQQLYLGSKMVPLTKVFLFILYPVAKPLALWLDILTHENDPNVPPTEAYDRSELSALVRIQHEQLIQQKRSSHSKSGGGVGSLGSGGGSRSATRPRSSSKDQSWTALKTELMGRVNDLNDDAEDAAPSDIYDKNTEEATTTVEPAVEQLTPPLHPHEVNLIEGTLKMKTSLVMDVYTPLSHVYAVPDNLILNKATIASIYSQGYSRVPVYHRRHHPSTTTTDNTSNEENSDSDDDKAAVLGFLITRQLMLIDWDHERELSTLPLQRPLCVSPRTNLIKLFDIFKKDGPLLTFVCARPDIARKALAAQQPIPVAAGYMGIVTLEDIMESILQQKIYDEGDIRDRDRAVATLTNWASATLQSFIQKNALRRKREREKQQQQRRNIMPSILENDKITPSSSTSPVKFRPENEMTALLAADRDSISSVTNYTNEYENGEVNGSDTLV